MSRTNKWVRVSLVSCLVIVLTVSDPVSVPATWSHGQWYSDQGSIVSGEIVTAGSRGELRPRREWPVVEAESYGSTRHISCHVHSRVGEQHRKCARTIQELFRGGKMT